MLEKPNLPTRPTEFVMETGDEKSVDLIWNSTWFSRKSRCRFHRTSSLGRKEEEKRKDEQKARNKKQAKKREVNKDLHYKATVEQSRVFLLQAYTHS